MSKKSNETIDNLIGKLDVQMSLDKANDKLSDKIGVSSMVVTGFSTLSMGLFMSNHIDKKLGKRIFDSAIECIELGIKEETNPNAIEICLSLPFSGAVNNEFIENITIGELFQNKADMLTESQQQRLFTALQLKP